MANHETKGNIGVTSENIFPVIKKFLYSDHEIFLRELVSNAIDATQKLKTLSSVGDFKGELGDLSVRIRIEDGKLIVSDRGIGMTAEEIERYINQIAFSGAEEFVQKYQNNASAIIGPFGLGFYSSFMVAKKVEIVTKSYKDGAVAMKWSCEGSPEYQMTETTKDDRGTDIILFIDDENKEFLEKSKITSLLNKYCRYLLSSMCGMNYFRSSDRSKITIPLICKYEFILIHSFYAGSICRCSTMKRVYGINIHKPRHISTASHATDRYRIPCQIHIVNYITGN